MLYRRIHSKNAVRIWIEAEVSVHDMDIRKLAAGFWLPYNSISICICLNR
ncbi:hypothetical protein [Extibacter muris]|nr:hypothetical protein [Extibacter muris]MCB6202593.1 hypothetical protein [Extibacter muris]MCQ4663830.1 hypothetical protein [Extibacter muris]MCQ4693396.1 hypothetical protein [Extibacter muris]